MTKQEKQLLLIDLCARLPYGVKATTKSTAWNDTYVIEGYKDNRFYMDCPVYEVCDDEWVIESIIPFLRPMSSMTDEEHNLLINLFDTIYNPKAEFYLIADFFNQRMLDYRNLIKQGLALEAPEGMYK